MYPVEEIPSDNRVFYRVHVNDLDENNELVPGVISMRPNESFISVDWEKYSSEEDARLRGRDPSKTGVIGFVKRDIVSVDSLEVRHDPDEERENRAHSGIFNMPDKKKDRKTYTAIRDRIFESMVGGDWLVRPPSI